MPPYGFSPATRKSGETYKILAPGGQLNTSAATLLSFVRSLGITVTADSGNIVIRPASKLTPELRANLRAAKPELLELLQAELLCKNLDAEDAASQRASGSRREGVSPSFRAAGEVPLADQLPDLVSPDPTDDQFVDTGNWDDDDQLGATAAASLRAPKIQGRSCNTKALGAVPRPDPEETSRRKALAGDILAGIAATADGDFIDPSNFDDVAPQDVAARTARLLDAQTTANSARQEAGRSRQATTPQDAAATPTPSEEAPLLEPKAAELPADGFDGLAQRLATALMVPRPGQRITDPARARAYFEARARHLLSRAKNPLAEIEREEHIARLFAAARESR
jgi:hypothetical protein